MSFEANVFINCPFDEAFYPLLRPLLFTVIYLGLEPRIALERVDSGEPRIQKIVELIRESRYAIHDLSRLQASEAGEFYRLNMPFELGLDVGCRLYGGGEWAEKKCLILEAESYRYQAALSDLSGSDIAVHNNEPDDVVVEVRNWLNGVAALGADGPTRIWDAFNVFMADNYDVLKARGFSDKDVTKLPVAELVADMKSWVSENVQ